MFEFYEKIKTNDFYYQVTITSEDMKTFIATQEHDGEEKVYDSVGELLDDYPELDFILAKEETD